MTTLTEPKALLTFSIIADHEDAGPGVPACEVRIPIKLYREDGEYVWRTPGHLGDEVETLPRPSSLVQAKADVRMVYPRASVWQPRATWL